MYMFVSMFIFRSQIIHLINWTFTPSLMVYENKDEYCYYHYSTLFLKRQPHTEYSQIQIFKLSTTATKPLLH